MGIILSMEEMLKIEQKKLKNKLCFNADCKGCYKSKPKCKKLSSKEMVFCQQRKSDEHPPVGFPSSRSRDAYSEFKFHRQLERERKKWIRIKQELKEYRKLKRDMKG